MINIAMFDGLGGTRIGVWGIKHLASPMQRWVYQRSGGRIFSSLGSDRQVLLMTTKGRRTGKDRTIPLFYLLQGEAVVICNVRPKYERTNPWVINLRSYPAARLQIGQHSALYHAREADENEVSRFWPRLVELWPAYKKHYDQGGRRSIFILERA